MAGPWATVPEASALFCILEPLGGEGVLYPPRAEGPPALASPRAVL